jgi:hypothetical protein
LTLSIAQKSAGFALAAVFAAGIATSARAEAHWQNNHPRRAEVNHRAHRQAARIHWERKEGKITQQQAMALHKDDRHVRHEERVAARQNGGHITPAEQHAFNRQENGVGKQIRGDATTAGGTTTNQ